MSRNSHWTFSIKKAVLLKILQYSWEKHELESLLDKVVPIQVFSCEYCEISKNTYFEEHMQTAASECRLQQQ